MSFDDRRIETECDTCASRAWGRAMPGSWMLLTRAERGSFGGRRVSRLPGCNAAEQPGTYERGALVATWQRLERLTVTGQGEIYRVRNKETAEPPS